MAAQPLIIQHDKWRKGQGGAPAGVAGESDGSSYAGLDLNLITFTASQFSGSSFSSTSFQDAQWSGCAFTGCTFADCDMQRIQIMGCTFVACTFDGAKLAHCTFTDCRFTDCTWRGLNFDLGQWQQVALLSCKGTGITAQHLHGQQVDFTGSQFENMQLAHAQINH